MEGKYRISFQIGELKFEIESNDKKWIEQKEIDYLKNVLQNTKIKPISGQDETSKYKPEPTISKSLTINEFYTKYIKNSKIKTRPNIAVFFVYYLEKMAKRENIRTQDVTQCFADISYPNYNKINMADVLAGAKSRALLNNVNNFWSLTTTGEDFVFNNLISES
jgi:hypothetical protein